MLLGLFMRYLHEICGENLNKIMNRNDFLSYFNKDAFIEELLRERACELGMEDARFFDLIRYKRADVFEKQLHGLFIYRLDDNGVRRDLPWRGNDEGKMAYPTHFEYENLN